ncbi:hypothetical protein [Salegentibacter chungangensis]|uniref:Uncharacterized protein n=1 Tax=Salegentibacter chungangensis TaxID=1335724 RepID=A0ABW3NP89_9FLAO
MKDHLAKLSDKDRALLLKAPALVSLLAASTDGKIDKKEKADAIELSHMRTFTAPPSLQPYYKEVEKNFKSDLKELIQKYSPLDEPQQEALSKETQQAYDVLKQLNEGYRIDLSESLKSYARHVGNVHKNFLQFFVFPLKIDGLTDY